VITQGDPEGVGPEVLVRALAAGAAGTADVTVLGEEALLRATANALGLPLTARIGAAPEPGRAATLWALEEACRLVNAGAADALCTAPIHKADLERLGFAFSGHTEFLAERLQAGTPTMMLAGETLRVALVTTHVPLAQLPQRITRELVADTIRRVHDGLLRWFGIAAPRIGVLGLNPHAGEGGLFGTEDRDRIAPAVATCRLRLRRSSRAPSFNGRTRHG
jgi:4-hydroxythreonine-4-phosphate dehydrogenase